MAAKNDDFSIKKISPKLGGERGSRNPNGPTSSHDLVEQMEFLYVQVSKAIDYSATNPEALPIVEITLGNYKSSTETLPPINKRRCEWEWDHSFAFDRSKGDVLSVTLKDGKTNPRAVIGKQNFKLAADIPTRIPPDAKLAPQGYPMKNDETGHHMNLEMSVWFGTQADEVYSSAWFSNACDVSASCVIDTRPILYIAQKLCYVRVTIVSGHDLISNDRRKTPSCYVTATLDNKVNKVALKTEIASGSNPTWNRDLLFVTSERRLLDGKITFKLFDRVDEQHDECIGQLERNLKDMTPLKLPGLSAPASFYDIEPPVKVDPAGDTRRFASTIKMKLAIDQSYHVFDECIQYSSDFRAFAPGLWGGPLGELEIGILGATGLKPQKTWRDGRETVDAYVVAKYGNKWARTRTVVNSVAPKWNEQYSWQVYERCTTVTLGLYDNFQIVPDNTNQTKDVPIGKVRIPLNVLEWDRLYTCSVPILGLGKQGLKKQGELQLAVRCVCAATLDARIRAPFSLLLPKSHYKNPLSLLQIEALRVQAVELHCLNLANSVPPLRDEVVRDMLKPVNRNFSMRKMKAAWERICSVILWFYDMSHYGWIHANVISVTNGLPKLITLALTEALFIAWFTYALHWLVINIVFPLAILILLGIWGRYMVLMPQWSRILNGTKTYTPSLTLIDLRLGSLVPPNLDELAEEFDSFPSSEMDYHVLRMRYDRLRKMNERILSLMSELASQMERVQQLVSYLEHPLIMTVFVGVLLFAAVMAYNLPSWLLILLSYHVCVFPCIVRWLSFSCWRCDLPTLISNFFRRLPTKEHLIL